MADVTAIATALSSLKSALDIAKFVKDCDVSVEGAEIKLQMAELISVIADAKIEVAELQGELVSRDSRIIELERLLAEKLEMEFDGKLYRVEGDPVPFCTVCYERDSKPHHLTYIPENIYGQSGWSCKVCKNWFRE